MKNLMKCSLIGYGFLIAVTVIETLLIGLLIGVTHALPAAYICIASLLAVFNGSIWLYAMSYLRTRRALDHTPK